jgi:hypothetical protein
VYFVDDVDLRSADRGCESYFFDEVADVIDPAVTRCVDFDEIDQRTVFDGSRDLSSEDDSPSGDRE